MPKDAKTAVAKEVTAVERSPKDAETEVAKQIPVVQGSLEKSSET